MSTRRSPKSGPAQQSAAADDTQAVPDPHHVPVRGCSGAGKYTDGEVAFRVRCGCGTDVGGLSWAEACDIAEGHRG